MRNDKIIPGVVLIMIGAVILLNNYVYIDFHWSNFIYLLPIFIVIAGINLIFAHSRSAWAIVLKVAVVIVGFALIVFGNFGRHHNNWWNSNSYYYSNDDSDSSSDDSDDNGGNKIVKVEGNSVFGVPFAANTKVATLNISGGGTVYSLSDTTGQLFYANTNEFKGKYIFKHSNNDSVYTLDFSMQNNHGMHFGWDNDGNKDKTNTATFKLNPNPEWEINVEAGATELNFDLSKFKVRSLKLSGGAASFDVKLGQPLAETRIKVEAGMADVNISIPANAACRITNGTGMSSTDFDGFTTTADNNFETPGFNAAKNKIYINISGALGSFKVNRY